MSIKVTVGHLQHRILKLVAFGPRGIRQDIYTQAGIDHKTLRAFLGDGWKSTRLGTVLKIEAATKAVEEQEVERLAQEHREKVKRIREGK